jgi:hypothetical protein
VNRSGSSRFELIAQPVGGRQLHYRRIRRALFMRNYVQDPGPRQLLPGRRVPRIRIRMPTAHGDQAGLAMKSSSSSTLHSLVGTDAEVNRHLRRVGLALAKRIVVTPSSGPGSWVSATTRANGFASIYRRPRVRSQLRLGQIPPGGDPAQSKRAHLRRRPRPGSPARRDSLAFGPL